MDAQRNGSTVFFSGILDEHTTAEALRKTMREAMHSVQGRRLSLDLSEVRRANSVGILTWFRLLGDLAPCVSYVNMPVWLVEQFNFSEGIRGDVDIESFQAPFYCPEKDTHAIKSLVVGRDVPIQANYDDFEISLPNPDGTVFEADFEPSEYLYFLVVNHAKLKSLREG